MPTTTAAQDATTEWLATAVHPTTLDTARERIAAAATTAIEPFVANGVATVPLSPGNGWTYDMVLTRLRDADENRWGGNLLVSIPVQRVCMVIHLPVLLFPSYVTEKLGDSSNFTAADGAILAAFLTLFSEAVADYLA